MIINNTILANSYWVLARFITEFSWPRFFIYSFSKCFFSTYSAPRHVMKMTWSTMKQAQGLTGVDAPTFPLEMDKL